MLPQAAAGHGSLAIVFVCLGIVGVNYVFTLRFFCDNIEIVNRDTGTGIDVTNCMNSHTEICPAVVLFTFLCFL